MKPQVALLLCDSRNHNCVIRTM